MGVVYLNGGYMPVEQAQVSVLDRGFLFGDGVYEVIPVYAGHPFRLEQHLERLEHSLAAIRLPLGWPRSRWAEVIREVVERNGGGHQSVYLQVTRGPAPRRDHRFPDQVEPTVLVMTGPLSADPTAPLALQGIRAVTLADDRWLHCDIKAISLLANVLLKQTALDRGADEALLLRDGALTEGAVSNVFAVVDGVVRTAPRSGLILGGITRDLIVELAAGEGIALEERAVSLEELPRASELWISSSSRELVPVVELDGRRIGDGSAGPVCRRLAEAYFRFKQPWLG